MTFHFDIKVTPFDLFWMTMKKVYKSWTGICNLIFTVSVIVMTYKFYQSAKAWQQLLLVVLCLVFPVFQPLGIYYRAKFQVASIPKDLKMDIDDSCIKVSAGIKSEKIPWSRVKGFYDEGHLLILQMDQGSGYFITNRVLNGQKESFKSFVMGKRESNGK